MIKYGSKNNLILGAFLVFLIDQMTKTWASKFLPLDKEIIVNYLFSLHFLPNEAEVMATYNLVGKNSLLTSIGQFNFIYTIVCFMFCYAILWITKQPALNEKQWTTEFAKTALFLILGGVLGNAFDRIFRGNGVIDFVRVKDGYNYDLIFNFADVAVYMGEFCIFVAWCLIVMPAIVNF
jgi:lipoprotein signal peptidase